MILSALLTRPGEAGLSGWLRSLERLVPTPLPYRDEQVDRANVLQLLRCDESTLDRLVAEGLPYAGSPGKELFDRSDLTNLALHSGSGRSLPELSAIFVMRLAAARVERWTERKRWSITIDLVCPEHRCSTGASWAMRRPDPASFGGRIVSLESNAHKPEAAGTLVSTDRPLSARAEIETGGEILEIVSPELRRLFHVVIDSYRFHSLPEGLETDADAVAAGAGVDCIGASVVLERACHAAGFEASAQKGYLLGILGVSDHGWLEVLDEDGRWKVLDGGLALVSRMAVDPNPRFVDFCAGSRLNRILPFGCPARDALMDHRCGERWHQPFCEVRVRPTVSTRE